MDEFTQVESLTFRVDYAQDLIYPELLSISGGDFTDEQSARWLWNPDVMDWEVQAHPGAPWLSRLGYNLMLAEQPEPLIPPEWSFEEYEQSSARMSEAYEIERLTAAELPTQLAGWIYEPLFFDQDGIAAWSINRWDMAEAEREYWATHTDDLATRNPHLDWP